MVRSLDNQQVRSFIAVELPEEVKLGLRKLQAELQLPGHTFVKWVAPESIHLTLKFLGNISLQVVSAIAKVMEEASRGGSPFRLTLGELGAFPNLRRPRVLWLGIGGEVDRLVVLQQRIDNGLRPLGFTPEARPFAPHLTLARLREGASADELREFGDLVAKKPAGKSYAVLVSGVSLMKSQLLPSGAVYSYLTKVELKG
jgi:2'-5' RNA ligase